MKKQNGSKRSILIASMISGVFCISVCVLLVSDQYHDAKNRVEIFRQELDGWNACRITEPEYYSSNVEEVDRCVAGLVEANKNFWVNLPKHHIIGIFVGVALVGGIVGSFAGWLLLIISVKIVGSIMKLFKREKVIYIPVPKKEEADYYPRGRKKLHSHRRKLVEV